MWLGIHGIVVAGKDAVNTVLLVLPAPAPASFQVQNGFGRYTDCQDSRGGRHRSCSRLLAMFHSFVRFPTTAIRRLTQLVPA